MYLEIPICMGNSGGCIEVFVKNFDAVVSAFRNQILIESGCEKPHSCSPPVRLTVCNICFFFFFFINPRAVNLQGCPHPQKGEPARLKRHLHRQAWSKRQRQRIRALLSPQPKHRPECHLASGALVQRQRLFGSKILLAICLR